LSFFYPITFLAALTNEGKNTLLFARFAAALRKVGNEFPLAGVARVTPMV
jgi:hypothetical protein